MKNFKYLFLVLLSVIITACSDKGSSEEIEVKEKAAAEYALKKYPIKSGIITFEKKELGELKKVKVFFDDFGVKERNEAYNTEGKVEEIRFTDGDKMYIINYRYNSDKIAYIMGSGKFGTEMKFVAEPFADEKDKEKHGYKKLENIEVCGKNCEAYSTKAGGAEVTFAGWNSLTLYSKTKMSMGESVTSAIEIKENVPVDASLFKVPSDHEIKKM